MSEREWRFYVEDMLRFAEKVRDYSRGLDQTAFASDEMRYDAIARNLELIGEAATHVPSEVRNKFTRLPWRQVIATRNRLIHGYLGIDNDTLWSILCDDIEPLIAQLRAMLESLCE